MGGRGLGAVYCFGFRRLHGSLSVLCGWRRDTALDSAGRTALRACFGLGAGHCFGFCRPHGSSSVLWGLGAEVTLVCGWLLTTPELCTSKMLCILDVAGVRPMSRLKRAPASASSCRCPFEPGRTAHRFRAKKENAIRNSGCL